MQVVITGASRGIGRALAQRLTARGDTVVGTSRDPDADWPLDVADPDSIARFVDRLGDRPVDLLVCNAGIFPDRHERLEDGFPAGMWADVFAVNVAGVFLCVQALLPHLRRADVPKIAIISSQMGASTKASGGSYIYRASKAAATNLGLNLAADLKGAGIAVGIYHPGWVQTDMGGMAAAVTPEASAKGLVARFDALDLSGTGRFETWDGQPHPV